MKLHHSDNMEMDIGLSRKLSLSLSLSRTGIRTSVLLDLNNHEHEGNSNKQSGLVPLSDRGRDTTPPVMTWTLRGIQAIRMQGSAHLLG